MKILNQILSLLLCTSISFSQAIVKEIKSGELKFPIIELANKKTAQKINDYLQTNLLEQTTLKNPGAKVFNKRRWTDSTSGIDELEYEIGINNTNLLSIVFSGETVGAYPSPLWGYYQFNIQNGEVILVEDIFTPTGLYSLEKDVKRRRKIIIEKQLVDLKKGKDKETREEVPNVKQELLSCNEGAEINNFSITKTGITFHKDYCLPHVIQALESDFDVSYSINGLQIKLSPFGKKLFSNTVTNISSDFFPSIKKPLSGKIDKHNIVLQLTVEKDNSVQGFYYYTSQGTCIDLAGTINKSKINLKEIDDDKTAVFDGAISGASIKGTWTNLKTKQSLPFEVSNKK